METLKLLQCLSDHLVPKYQCQWSPQPGMFNVAEQHLLTKIEQTHILDRVRSLRSSIDHFAQNVTWKEYAEGDDGPMMDDRTEKGKQIPETSSINLVEIFNRHSYNCTNTHLNLDLLESLLYRKAMREQALVHLVSWILISNISLEGESSWNLISPTLVEMWNACRPSHTGIYTNTQISLIVSLMETHMYNC